MDEKTSQVVGFITAISDGVLSAYIPLLEVLPEYKNAGIGKELVERMLKELQNIYMIDLMCDVDVQPYYEQFGMAESHGMIIRNYEMQAGNWNFSGRNSADIAYVFKQDSIVCYTKNNFKEKGLTGGRWLTNLLFREIECLIQTENRISLSTFKSPLCTCNGIFRELKMG